MKKKLSGLVLSVLLICTLLFSSCANPLDLAKVEEALFNVKITIETINTVNDKSDISVYITEFDGDKSHSYSLRDGERVNESYVLRADDCRYYQSVY